MRIVSRSLVKWLILGGILATLGYLVITAENRIHWVGRTDMETEFIVTDAVTKEAIQGATIRVEPESDSSFAYGEKQKFTMVTDSSGSVKRLCKDCMSFGTEGHNIVTGRSTIDTWCIHLPHWFYRVTAKGYTSTGRLWLDDEENQHQAQRGNRAKRVPARLVIEVKLEKETAAPSR